MLFTWALLSLILPGVVLGASLWTPVGPSAPSTPIQVTFSLPSNPSQLEELFYDISNPSSPNWGKHLSQKEVDALAGPSASTQSAAVTFLSSTGCFSSPATFINGGLFVTGVSNVSCVESTFNVKYTHYVHTSGRAMHRYEGQPTLPPSLTSMAPSPSLTRVAPRPTLSASAGQTTPTTIRAAYGIGGMEGSGSNKSTVVIAGFLQEYAEDLDLQKFFSTYYPKGKGRKFSVVGPNSSPAGVEASLDVQYVMSIGANVNAIFWYTDAGSGPNPYDNEPYLTFLTAVSALPDADLPHSISVSYADDEFTIDPKYLAAVEVLMLKLGARGVSMMHASGDGGVSGTQYKSKCPGGRFVPTWPASCPYITSVGATDTSYAKGSGFSGGSFSNLHGIPPYQTGAVAGYFASGTPLPTPPSLYNASGRGVPDVSAVGENFMIVNSGQTEGVDGTSCSTPTFAGMIALINDARVAARKRPLGFLNQLLYANPKVFTDVVLGNNPGCGSTGFQAAVGWDPITGLGAPKFQDLYKLAMSLP